MKILSIITLFWVHTIYSQVEYTDTLNFNNISAIIGDEGHFFNNTSVQTAGYEIPKGSVQKLIVK